MELCAALVLRASAFQGNEVSLDLGPFELTNLFATCSGQYQQSNCITERPSDFASSIPHRNELGVDRERGRALSHLLA